jgi:hypothetical protein
MTPLKPQSKIEQSPYFQRIVELYREHEHQLSKKEIFNRYIQALDPSLRYHQFIRLTLKLARQETGEGGRAVIMTSGEVNTAKVRQELYLKALQLGDQSLTSTLELWEKQPEKITSRQLRDFFKMYKEMEQVRQADEVIDLKKKEQEFEQKFKPAGLYAHLWVQLFRQSCAGRIQPAEVQILRDAVSKIEAMRGGNKLLTELDAKFDYKSQVVEGIPAAN